MAKFYVTTWGAICRNCGREHCSFAYSGPRPYNRGASPEGNKKVKDVRQCFHCEGPCDWVRTDEVVERVGNEAPPRLTTFKSGSGRKPVLKPCPLCGEGMSARQFRSRVCPHCKERFKVRLVEMGAEIEVEEKAS